MSEREGSVEVLKAVPNVRHSVARVVLQNSRLRESEREREQRREFYTSINKTENTVVCVCVCACVYVCMHVCVCVHHIYTYPGWLTQSMLGKANSRCSNDRWKVFEVWISILHRQFTKILKRERERERDI